jgi:aldose 1-epimerase
MPIKQSLFGTTSDNHNVDLFTLTNDKGLTARITNLGGRITELHVPDRKGDTTSIVLGYDSVEPYVKGNPYFGALVGRYANRIAKGSFTLDGVTHKLPTNNGPNTLHGGPEGFDKKIWHATPSNPNGTPTLRLAYDSPDNEMGFPGNLETIVTCSLTDKNELRIDYVARTDKPTVVNLSNHSYFNLKGAGHGDILDHLITIHADHYTPVDEHLIPTGAIAPVHNTPFDFTDPQKIGARIDQVHNGYDHNFVLNPPAASPAIRVTEESTGRAMEVSTTQPGVQFYTGGFLNGRITGVGGTYPRFGAFCLETQHFPDSPNQPLFPTTVLRPGETFVSTTIYRFFTT